MQNLTIPCIYPLVDTDYPSIPIQGGMSCGLSCADPRLYYTFFTHAEEKKLENILFVMSLISICLVPIYFVIVMLRNIRTRVNFCSLPFSYQCPVFISCGYILMAFITMTPYIFGSSSIVCSKDQTLIWKSLRNVGCTLTAIGMYISIRLAAYYTCTLSVSLVITLYYPNAHQVKRWCHCSVWFCIALGIIPLLLTKSACGDYFLGFCTPCLTSREHLLLQTIIPLGACLFIFCVCLTMASIKLLQQNQVSKVLAVSNHMRSLFVRVLQYNLLQTTAWVAVVSTYCYMYTNIDSWENTLRVTVRCQMELTFLALMSQMSVDSYEMCLLEHSDQPRPLLLTYWIYPLCSLISILSAMLFECSLRERQRSINTVKDVVAVLTNRMTSTTTRGLPSPSIHSVSSDSEKFDPSMTESGPYIEKINLRSLSKGDETAVLEYLDSSSPTSWYKSSKKLLKATYK